ncbi:hypothetical protein JCM5353_006158 [Sporobolomyces roseus]
MASSTSPNPASPLGECVVCGKESSTRCSSCAKGGVDWMFFCSQDHQKLIWSVHKRVCGGSFKWPALKSKERDEMIALSTKPYRRPNGMTTWLQQLRENVFDKGVNPKVQRVFGGDAKLFEMITQNIVEAGGRPVDQALVYEFRATAFSIKVHSEPFLEHLTYTDYLNLTQADPLGFPAYSQRSWFEHLEERRLAQWYSELQHRLLVLIALLVVCKTAAENDDQVGVREQTPLFVFAFNKVCEFTRGPLAGIDPPFSVVTLEAYLPSVLKELGVDLVSMTGETERPWYHHSGLFTGSVMVKGAPGGDYRVNSE